MAQRALIVRGHQGVGKTAFSTHFAEAYSFCRLSKDDIYKPLLTRYKNHRLASDIAYSAIRSVLSANRDTGISFVIDAPFNGPVGPQGFLTQLNEWGFLANTILLICSDRNIWQHRLQLRDTPDAHPETVTTLEQIISYRGTLEAQSFPGEPVFDTASSSVPKLTAMCMHYLMQSGGTSE